MKVTAYVFDQFGYHELPVTTDSDGVVDLYGPDQAHDCDYSKGVYCIDRKLLSLMVGWNQPKISTHYSRINNATSKLAFKLKFIWLNWLNQNKSIKKMINVEVNL